MRNLSRNQFFVLAVMLLMIIQLSGCLPNPFSEPPEPPTPTAEADLTVQVQVEDAETGESLENVTVMLTLEDESGEPVSRVTDSTGKVLFTVPASEAGKTGRVLVQAEGYEEYSLNMVLASEPSAEVISLTRLTAEVTKVTDVTEAEPTDEPTVIPTPVAEATPTSTAMPTSTATPLSIVPPDEIPLPKTAEEAVEIFRQQGYFTAGVRNDAPPFGKGVNGGLEGFDIDLMHEFAKRWLGDENMVRLTPVPASERINVLEKREVDLVAAAMTYTDERCSRADCSQTYALDGARLLVRADSGINSICDLDGKFVSVLAGTSAKENIEQIAPRWCAYNTLPQVSEYEQRAAAIEAVVTNVVAAYTTDGLILEQFANETLIVVGDEFRPEPYHTAVTKGASGLLSLINLTLQEMKADGTYDALHEKWFGCRNAPFPIIVDEGVTRPDFVKSDSPLQPNLCERADNSSVLTYQMQGGDTLGGVAIRHYGDYNLYVCIQQANEIADDQLNSLPVGTVLELPPLEQCQNG